MSTGIHDAAQASAEHAASVAAMRLRQLLDERPPRFAAEGDLDPDVAAWALTLGSADPANLVLSGDTGRGKTWAAWHAAEHALRNGYTGRVEFVGSARFREIVSPPTDFHALRVMGSAGLLILDDVGASRLSEWDTEHLAGVIDARSAAMVPTLITTNINDLRAMFGDRIASRLAENLVKIMLRGPDRRRGGVS